MQFSKGEASIIVVLALIAISLAVYIDYRSKVVPVTDENTIVVHIPERSTIDESFYDSLYDAASQSIDNPSPNPSQPVPVDAITSKAYLVGNIRTGEIYLARNERMALPIASMSKLMTAYVGMQVLTPTTTVTVTKENAEVYPDQSNLVADERFEFDTILYPLLLSSSNVAAEAIATAYGRTDFLELMSSYAWEIGLPTSYFSDPSGLSPQNRASALGFFELTTYIFNTKRDLFDLTKKPAIDIATTTDHGSHVVTSTHPFVTDRRFLGGKTGRTPEAGDTMLTVLDIGGDPIAFIVLGGAYDKRKSDTDKLIDRFMSMKK